MSIEVYGHEFSYGHERKAFGYFLQDMCKVYENSKELYVIIAENQINAAKIDLLLIGPRMLVIIELKELGQAAYEDINSVSISGTEGGTWRYHLPNGSSYPIGGNNDKNPYQQISSMRYNLAEWFVRNRDSFPDHPTRKENVLDHMKGWVALSPGFDEDKKNLDLPWEKQQTRYWFDVVPINRLAEAVYTTDTDTNFVFPEDQVHELVRKLGVKPLDISIFLRKDVIDFFIRCPISRNIVNRKNERSKLREYLQDNKTYIINIGGPGGVGKTELAAWVAGEAKQLGYDRVLWIDCSRREVTVETFLTAIADEVAKVVGVHDKRKSSLICAQEQKMLDRLDAALDFLEEPTTLLIFDDYHMVSSHKGLDEFMCYVANRARKLRVILATRERPEYLNDPRWPIGVVQDLLLEGVPFEEAYKFISDGLKLTTSEFRRLWKLTAGNPRALRLSMYNISKGENIETLFPAGETDELFSMLLDRIEKDIRPFVYRFSVARSGLSWGLIKYLLPPDKKELAKQLAYNLVSKYILKELDSPGNFSMDGLAREFLYAEMQEKTRQKAHSSTGNYFVKLADDTSNNRERLNYLVEALYHFEHGQKTKSILKYASAVYNMLVYDGDWGRAQTVATQALKAALADNDLWGISFWSLRLAEQKISQERFQEAETNLEKARSSLPKSEKKIKRMSAKPRSEWQKLEAEIYIQRGRLAYRRSDYDPGYQFLEEGLKIARVSGDQRTIAGCLLWLGRVHRHKKQYEQAKAYFSEARDIAQKLKDKELMIESISHLGLIAHRQDNIEIAKEQFTKAYRIALEEGDLRAVEINRGHLGEIALENGDITQAEEAFRECLQKAQEIRNGLGIRINLGRLAHTLIQKGEYQEAESLIADLEQRGNRVNDALSVAFGLKYKGLITQHRGDIERGNNFIKEGIRKLEKHGIEIWISDFEKCVIEQ